MESVIKELKFYNATAGKEIGALGGKAATGAIIDIANFGLLEATVQWNENTIEETRSVAGSNINAATYNIRVYSEVYDDKSAAGDTCFLYLTRLDSDNNVDYTRYCFGVLQAIERNRFERNNTTLYDTTYILYCSNPIFGSIARPLSEIEEDNLSIIYIDDITLNPDARTYINVRPHKRNLNTTRGVRIRLKMNDDAVYLLPFTLNCFINNVAFDITYKKITTDEIILFFGESEVSSNCARGVVSGRWTPKFETNLFDKYIDYSQFALRPIQWANNALSLSFLPISDYAMDGSMHIEVETVVGDYF